MDDTTRMIFPVFPSLVWPLDHASSSTVLEQAIDGLQHYWLQLDGGTPTPSTPTQQVHDTRRLACVAAARALALGVADAGLPLPDPDDEPPRAHTLQDEIEASLLARTDERALPAWWRWRLTAPRWALLAEAYNGLADAGAAAVWLSVYAQGIPAVAVQDVVCSAVCAQRVFYRASTEYQFEEPYQQQVRAALGRLATNWRIVLADLVGEAQPTSALMEQARMLVPRLHTLMHDDAHDVATVPHRTPRAPAGDRRRSASRPRHQDATSTIDPVVLERVRRWTTGKRALMLAGDPRPEARQALAEQLAFATLEWPAVRYGHHDWLPAARRADVILVSIKYVNRAATQLCLDLKRAGTTEVVLLQRGHGVAEIVQAIDAHYTGTRRTRIMNGTD